MSSDRPAMHGYLSFLLHAHLPFVRHPEHERFLEESWFYEAVAETYLPLASLLQRWEEDRLPATCTLTLSPTLCSMLRDRLLQRRCTRRLEGLIGLAEMERHRCALHPERRALAQGCFEQYHRLLDMWHAIDHDLVGLFGTLQARGRIEIITCAATHALLPLLTQHPPSVRAQILTACDHYLDCFGVAPRGIWLPECAYADAVEPLLKEAGLRWFALESHGVLHATPQPRFGIYAPILTRQGLAAFGRDLESATQVWSRTEGYPGDPRYRDFYRDLGYDLDFDQVQPFLPSPNHRGFTGLKFHRITGPTEAKELYDPQAALRAVEEHAEHFVQSRLRHVRTVHEVLGRSPLLLMPYDAELFGHWWHEGLDFLDQVIRKISRHSKELTMITPSQYLKRHATHQMASPAASSWGEHGYFEVWINEANDWILPHLTSAQDRMTELAQRFQTPDDLVRRALMQAARELMLAQASDWPFLLRTGTSPSYARQRVTDHLVRFNQLYDQLMAEDLDEPQLRRWELQNNLFPDLDHRHYRRQ
jgi:1,4-alpha-glucan branching enzyme